MKNNFITIIVVGILLAGVGFYGGMQYQKSQRPNFAGGQIPGGFGGPSGANGKQMPQGSQPVSGKIASIDNTGITLTTSDGSSKIVLVSDSTVINKTTSGSQSDLKNGDQVMVIGTTSSDGTVTAQSISLGSSIR